MMLSSVEPLTQAPSSFEELVRLEPQAEQFVARMQGWVDAKRKKHNGCFGRALSAKEDDERTDILVECGQAFGFFQKCASEVHDAIYNLIYAEMRRRGLVACVCKECESW